MAYEVKGDLDVARRVSSGLAVNLPSWQSGKDYLVDDLFVDGGTVYRVTTAHTSTVSVAADAANLSAVGGSSLYSADGTLAGARTVELGGNAVTFTETAATQAVVDEGGVSSRGYGFVPVLYTHANASSVTPNAIDELHVITIDATSTTDVPINPASGASAGLFRFRIQNNDTVARNVVFDARYKGFDAATNLGTIALAAGEYRYLEFRMDGLTGTSSWVLVEDTAGFASGDSLYTADGTLTGARTVTMGTNDLTLSGVRDTVLSRFAVNEALEWRRFSQGFLFGAGTFTPDIGSYGDMNVGIANTDVGDLTIAVPTTGGVNGSAERYTLSFTNSDTVARNLVFDAHYKDRNGVTIGTQVVQPGTIRHFNFHYESGGITGSFLDHDYAASATSSPWQYSAGNQTVADGDRWVVAGAHTMTFPASPANGQSVQFVPGNGDWDTLGAAFATTDTATVASGQAAISSGADVVEFVYNATTDNWAAYSNGATGTIPLGPPGGVDVITFVDQTSFTAAQLQAYYNGVAGGAAPDTVPQEVNDYLATIPGPAPDWYVYLGHNQWYYTNAANPTATSWVAFPTKQTFSAPIHFPGGLVTARP